jgi:regulator of replication initiation timing
MSDINPIDGIVGRFISATDEARNQFVKEMRAENARLTEENCNLHATLAKNTIEIYGKEQEIETPAAPEMSDQQRLFHYEVMIEGLNAVLDGIVNRSTDHQDAIARARWRAVK